MAGRKPLPNAVKEARGTLQKCRETQTDSGFEKIIKIPSAPRWFSDTAKKIYKATGKELARIGVLHTIGLPLLIAYSQSMALHLELEEEFATKPRVMALKNPDGSLNKIQTNPKHKISREALEDARKIASEFGLTPAAQSKIISNIKPSEDPDEAELA